MNTSIKIHFSLTGKFDPNDITTTFDGLPTKTWRFGDLIERTIAKYKHDGWEVSSDEIESLDLNEQVKKLVDTLHPYSSELKEIIGKFNLYSEISCEIWVENDNYPAIHFDHQVLARILNLNAEIDIDIY